MWHFGRDSLVEYTNDKSSITVETAQHILTRLYVKEFKGKNKIRIEKQEYPQENSAGGHRREIGKWLV
jgi:hypothetical protein